MALTEEEQDLIRTAGRIRELYKSEEWTIHSSLLTSAIEAWRNKLETPIHMLEGRELEEAYNKGALYGLRLAHGLFDSTLEAAQEVEARERQRLAGMTEAEIEADYSKEDFE